MSIPPLKTAGAAVRSPFLSAVMLSVIRMLLLFMAAAAVASEEMPRTGASSDIMSRRVDETLQRSLDLEFSGDYVAALESLQMVSDDLSSANAEAVRQRIAWQSAMQVLSLASAAGAFGQTEVLLSWGPATLQMNYTPGMGIREVAEDVCEELAGVDDGGCFASLLEQLLLLELQYFNARDSKNLTWQQRPVRFLDADVAEAYTRGFAEVLDAYRDDSHTQYYRTYDEASINVLVNRASSLLPGTNYRDIDALIYHALANGELEIMRNARVAVIGSVMPWYEALVIAHGAAAVTTFEYNRLQYNHPKLSTVLVSDSLDYAGLEGVFDLALSISSFEHDGLGRYGDPLNPDGDLLAMRNTRRLLKQGGVLLLAVPCGADAVVWNIHRIYGPHRLPLLLRGWRLIASYGLERTQPFPPAETFVYQPLFILQLRESEFIDHDIDVTCACTERMQDYNLCKQQRDL